MGNIYTGSNSGKAGLNVKKTDNTVDVFGVSQIQLGNNMTLLDNGNGSVTINSTGGGGGGSGVTELSFGSTGLTPAVATTGSITVAGTLDVGSGGTGLNSLGSANEFLKVDSGATALEYSDGLTYVSTAGSRQLKIVDSSADAMLVLESTASGATNAPDLKLFRNKSPPQPDDVLGQIKFTALEGNTQTEVDYARIEARIDSGGLTTYGGSLDFYITNDAAEVRMLTISGEGSGNPNMSFDVNPDGDGDGDFRHFGNGGVNIFSDADQNRIEIQRIYKYAGVNPSAGDLLIGDGSVFKRGSLTSTGGSITITNGAGTINLETTIAGYESWIVQDGGGLTTNIDSGDTLEIAGGTGITTTLSGTGTTTPTLTIDVDGTSPTGSGVANQVTYWDGANSIAGDNDFVFDSVNKRVGIGLTAPDVDLEIRATDDDKAELRVSRNTTQYTEIMNEDAQGGFIFNSSPQSNKKPLRIDAVHNNTGVAAGTLYIDLRLGQSQESGGNPQTYFRVIEEGLNSEPEVVVNESSNSVNFRVETNNETQAFFMDGSADTATFNVPLTINDYTLPTADGNAGEFITTDGAGTLSFAAGGGGGTPAGSATEIQFNSDPAGSFDADSGLTYDPSASPKMLKLGSGDNALPENPVAFTQFCYDASDLTSRGGEIISTDGGIGMRLGGFGGLNELSGFRLDDRRHQFDVGKTTTQSFGQTQNSFENTGGTVNDCYPSQGGLIVFTGSSTPLSTDTINLVLAQDGASGGFYNARAKPFITGGFPPTFVPDVTGYGTWQIGDQVTVVAALDPGSVPNITIRSYNSVAVGSTTPSAAPTDASATGTPINGVDSSTAGGGQQTITTNFTAKTFILIEDRLSALGVQWVCIG